MTTWYKRRLNGEQIDIMYQKLQHIPKPAYHDIVESILEDSRYFPTIVDIKNRYNSWRSAHPEQTAAYERTVCLDCHSKGFLWFMQYNEELKTTHEVVARCGACENWTGDASTQAPMRHRATLEREGFEITHPKKRAKSEEDLVPKKTDKHHKIILFNHKVIQGGKQHGKDQPTSFKTGV